MGDLTDQALVERVQRGDKHSFDLLVSRYQHRIVKLVSRFVRDRDDAQDVAQEAFIKAYRALANFRGESAFYTWLYRIAINTAKNHLTAAGRRPVEADLINADGEETSVGRVAEGNRNTGSLAAGGRDEGDYLCDDRESPGRLAHGNHVA